MKRQIKKQGRRILNRILIVLLIIALIIYLLGLLNDYNNKIDLLIKLHEGQQIKIEQLETDYKRVSDVVIYQHQKIKELESQVNAKVVSEPIKESQVHKQEKVDNEREVHNDKRAGIDFINSPTPIIVGGLMAIKAFFGKMLSPVF